MGGSAKHYRIGQVARELGVNSSVVRYWETEFPVLQPMRLPSGHRVFSERDVKTLRRIKDLLYNRGLTIEGARQTLEKSLDRDGLITEDFERHSSELVARRKALASRRRLRKAVRHRGETGFLEAVADELKSLRAELVSPFPGEIPAPEDARNRVHAACSLPPQDTQLKDLSSPKDAEAACPDEADGAAETAVAAAVRKDAPTLPDEGVSAPASGVPVATVSDDDGVPGTADAEATGAAGAHDAVNACANPLADVESPIPAFSAIPAPDGNSS